VSDRGHGRESDQPVRGRAGPGRAIDLPAERRPAISGIGEKFAANPVTGTDSLSIPLAISPACSGFGPRLSLSYDSGSDYGPFVFGWSLSLPAITRRTDKGLLQHWDAQESDVFAFFLEERWRRVSWLR